MMPQRTILTTGDDIVLAHSWTQTILGHKVASNIESVSRTVLIPSEYINLATGELQMGYPDQDAARLISIFDQIRDLAA
jgi:hypothetical protein